MDGPIRYIARSDGTSFASVDVGDGNRGWRFVTCDEGRRSVRHADTWWEAWAMATEWRDVMRR